MSEDDIYKCPVCHGESQLCDDEYQSQECELLEKEMSNDN
jgi:hypothetical protein